MDSYIVLYFSSSNYRTNAPTMDGPYSRDEADKVIVSAVQDWKDFHIFDPTDGRVVKEDNEWVRYDSFGCVAERIWLVKRVVI